MKAFADLYAQLDETTKTNDKVAALARYFAATTPADAALAVYFLTGRKPRQVVGTEEAWATGRPRPLRSCPGWTSRTMPSATSPRPSPCSCLRPIASSTCR